MRGFYEWLKQLAGGCSPNPSSCRLAIIAALLCSACATEAAPAPAAEADFAVVAGALGDAPWLYYGVAQSGWAAKNLKPEFRFDGKKAMTFQVVGKAQTALSSVAVTLFKQAAGGSWSTIKKVSGKGSVTVSNTPSADGVYRVVYTVSPSEQALTVNLTCTSKNCSIGGQPGASCGSRGQTPCATGLFCNYKPGALCGMADAPGFCSSKPQICPMNYAPVCGCNGKTYSNNCAAAAAGAGVLDNGPCKPACKATTWQPLAISKSELVREWAEVAGSKPATTYSFAADGSFTRQDAVSPCPPGAQCIWSGIVSSNGTWTLSGTTVQLSWKVKASGWKLLFPTAVKSLGLCGAFRLQEQGGAAETFE